MFGPISLVAFVLVTIGALALAVVFGWLAQRIPGSGGPYLYAREAFGDFAGFINGWSYWVTAWAGNAPIVVALTGYVEVFVNKDHNIGWSIVIATTGLWIPVLINVVGIGTLGAAQAVFTVLKIVPLVLIAIVGLFFIKAANFGAFNSSGTNAWSAIAGAGAIVLFAYLGIETASVAAGRVRNREERAARDGLGHCHLRRHLRARNPGRVRNGGRQGAANLDCSLQRRRRHLRGHLGGELIAAAAIISGLGCLVGWTFIVGEMPHAAAKDGMFPKVFARETRGMPIFGILSSTVLATLLTVLAYTNFSNVFETVLLLTVFTSVIPYMFSAGAQVFFLVTHRGQTSWSHFVKDLTISIVALAFTFWALAGSGAQACYYGVFCFLLGVPLYIWLRASKKNEVAGDTVGAGTPPTSEPAPDGEPATTTVPATPELEPVA